MAVVALPSIRTVITGDNIAPFDKTTSFTLGEKLESLLYLKASDGDVSIDYSKINNIAAILFYSASAFTVSITIDVGTTEIPNVVVIPFTTIGNFRLDPSSALMTKISAISLATASATDITVYTNIYGAAVS